MKISIRMITLIAIIFGSVSVTKAQTSQNSTASVNYSVGFETGLPTGSLHQTHTWMVGGSLQADIPIVSQTYVTVNGGYYNITGRDNNGYYGGSAPSLRILPAKAGLKFFPLDFLYVQGEAGAAFALNKQEAGYAKTAAFIYAPTIGVKLPIAGTSSIDAGIRYEGSTNFTDHVNQTQLNFFALRVAYSFSIK